MASRSRFLCLDCKVDTGKIGEHYMLTDTVWYSIHTSNVGMLCVECIEKRLKRRLNKFDFNQSHVNRISPGQSKSLRLLDRMKSEY